MMARGDPVQADPASWMLLIHQLPTKPGYPEVQFPD